MAPWSTKPSFAVSLPARQGSPTLADAQARLQAQDAAGAAKLLEDITAREPKNARAWRMLGTARHRAADYDRAIAAYVTALTVEPDHPVALYNLGASAKAEPVAPKPGGRGGLNLEPQ